MGQVFRLTGRMAEALAAGQKAIELASGPKAHITRASSYYNSGKVYEALGKYPEAIREYQNAKQEVNNPIYDRAILKLQEKGFE